MDRLAEVLRRTYPVFVTEYETSRGIIHTPGTRPDKEEEENAKQASSEGSTAAKPKAKSRSKSNAKSKPGKPAETSTATRPNQLATATEEKGLEA